MMIQFHLTRLESLQVEKQHLQTLNIITQQGGPVQSKIQRPHRWRLTHTQVFDCINEFVAFATSEREFDQ
jgi:hypothetical protein